LTVPQLQLLLNPKSTIINPIKIITRTMKKFTLTLATLALGAIVTFAQTPAAGAKKAAPAKPSTATAPAKGTATPAAAAPSTPASTQPDFLFEAESHDFGSVPEGTQATYEFKFTNVGKEPLIISNVQASCGCTTPKWSNEPIAPGKTGTVTASYNSSGRPGPFTKTITVTSNAKSSPKALTISGVVEAKPVEQPSPVVVPEQPKN